jgi:two-component system response regulator YesN
MKTLLVVDDEILVRMGIRTMLGDKDCGYVIGGEASGGKEAAQLLENLNPDILLTDLVMADGNGIELINAVRKIRPGLAIVVLSCRNEFDYVREALRAGADDYVFKPTLTTADLLEAFERALEKHPELPTPGGELMPPAPAGTAGSTTTDEALCLLEGDPTAWTDPLPPCFPTPHRLLYLYYGEDYGNPVQPHLANLLREIRRQEPSILASTPEGLLLLREEGRSGVKRVFALAEEYGRRYLGRMPLAGVSGASTDARELPKRLAEASAAANRAFRIGPVLVFAEDLDARSTLAGRCNCCEEGSFQPPSYAEAGTSLRRAVEALDQSSIEQAFGAVLCSLSEAADLPVKRLRLLIVESCLPFKEKARALGLEPDGSHPGLSPEGLVASVRNLEELRSAFPAFVAHFIEQTQGLLGARREIIEIRRWVLRDLRGNFRVEDAAARVGMSASHFAHIFKRDTGTSFIDFVNVARMEKARELLLGSDLLVRQVADAVGIDSLNHFGQLFRRRFGFSPNEFRLKGRRIQS